MSVPDTQSHVGRQIAGGCLLAVGLVMAVVCGACTLIVCIAAVLTGLDSHARESLALVLIALAFTLAVGGVPTMIGMVMVVFGWRLFRRPRPIARPENTFV